MRLTPFALPILLAGPVSGCLVGYDAQLTPTEGVDPVTVAPSGPDTPASPPSSIGEDAGEGQPPVTEADGGGELPVLDAGLDASEPDEEVPGVCDPGPCWGPTGWRHRNRLVLSSTLVTKDLVNFPVLVSATFEDWKVQPYGLVERIDGSDIVFTTADGTQRLDHEIEFYNSLTGQLIAWVEVPLVSAESDTELLVYYGNPGTVDEATPQDTWDEGGANHFRGVWHLGGGGTEPRPDSTQYGNDCTALGVEDGEPSFMAVAGLGELLDGIDDELSCPHSASLDIRDGLTLSMWLNPTGPRPQAGQWLNGPLKTAFGLYLYGAADDRTTLATDVSVNSERSNVVDRGQADVPPDRWTHLAVTYDGQQLVAYVNGRQDYAVSLPGSLDDSSGLALNVGAPGGGAGHLKATIDELRVSATARSPEWLATAFHNQRAPGSFVEVLERETVPDEP